jgi:precorrin-2 dehydrogenase/sirohydrochlorin ferrochelatase
MLVDLRVRGTVAVVLGSGEPARSRARMLRKEGARVVVIRRSASPHDRAGSPRAREGTRGFSGSIALVKRLRPRVVFATSWNDAETPAILRAAHAIGALVHVYDTPELSDFTMPSIGGSGSIRIAVSSSGHSPAMAVLLRRRMERSIRPIDVARVRLQGRLRKTILLSVPTQEGRRSVIYRILRHREIGRLLRDDRFEEAVALGRKVIATYARAGTATARSS